ncbi:hypothetical protein N8878_00960 [Psychromonas sp.]|nr:hypothetical protein [Psychromonas sp.]
MKQTLATTILLSFILTGCNSSSSDGSKPTDPGTGLPEIPEMGDPAGQRVALSDVRDDQSGQLFYQLEQGLTKGEASVYVLYPEYETEDVAVTLYGSTLDSKQRIIDVQFKENGDIKLRDVDGVISTHTPGEWTKVTVSWDEATEESTLSINDLEIGSYDFLVNEAKEDDGETTKPLDGVHGIAVKLSDNAGESAYETYVDNLSIYDITDSTEAVLVFEDDYERYSLGEDLSIPDENVHLYSDKTKQAVIVDSDDETDPEEPTDPEPVVDDFESYSLDEQIDTASNYLYTTTANGMTTFATISNDFAESGEQSLRLSDEDASTKPVVSRAFAEGAATSGSVTSKVYIPTEGYDKSTYIYLGNSESASSGSRFTEVVFASSTIKFRDENTAQVNIEEYSKDTWVSVTISWGEEDDTGKHPITVNIDGTDYTEIEGVPMYAENAGAGAPTLMALYVGDGSSVATYSYFDDLSSSLFEDPAE